KRPVQPSYTDNGRNLHVPSAFHIRGCLPVLRGSVFLLSSQSGGKCVGSDLDRLLKNSSFWLQSLSSSLYDSQVLEIIMSNIGTFARNGKNILFQQSVNGRPSVFPRGFA